MEGSTVKDYHCCATCQHFQVYRTEQGPKATCLRLGYETKPSYKFHCWNPRPDIRTRMKDECGAET